MPQEKSIQFNMFTTTVGNDITITYYYDDIPVLTISAFIADEDLTSNGTSVKQGEGAIVTDGTDTFYTVSSDGELVVYENELGEYSIDDNGELIYII